MKNTLVVVTYLACFKVFKLETHHFNRTPRLELVETFDNAEAHGRLGDRVSDLSGRFPRGAGSSNARGTMSDGERHNIGLELRKRQVRQLANRLNTLARSQQRNQSSTARRTRTPGAREDREEYSSGPDEVGENRNSAALLTTQGCSGVNGAARPSSCEQ